MERSFRVSEQNDFYKNMDKYYEMVNHQKQLVGEFLKENGIQSTLYRVLGDGFCNIPFKEKDKKDIRLGIVPTEEDVNTYDKVLCKPMSKGLRIFKTNSKIGKLFADFAVENEIVINILSVDIRDYFKSLEWYNRCSQESFKFKDYYYLKINSEDLKEDDIPEGMEVIKTSEFYEIMEEFQEENKDIKE